MSRFSASEIHATVLCRETVEFFRANEPAMVVDATLGLGGHTEAILEAIDGVRVIGIDQDDEAIALASERLQRFADRIEIVRSNFALIKSVLAERGIKGVDGIVADLGVSSLQFDSPERGFSFRFDAPLDMRMNAADGDPTAADLLRDLSEEEIADIIYRYGEERNSRRIARRIVWKRSIGEPILTTAELAETVEKAAGGRGKDKIHPATRTFQALRIAVNRELEVLENFLTDAIDVLAPGGTIAVITFHSLEDRIVKQAFSKAAGKCICPPRLPQCQCGAEKKLEILTRKPISPEQAEIDSNPRARSAKLRAAAKLKRG